MLILGCSVCKSLLLGNMTCNINQESDFPVSPTSWERRAL